MKVAIIGSRNLKVLAFWDGKSRGTKYVIDNCQKKQTCENLFAVWFKLFKKILENMTKPRFFVKLVKKISIHWRNEMLLLTKKV